MLSEQELKHKLVSRCRNNPEYFIRTILGKDPWEKQVEVVNSVRDFKRTVVRSCHGVGKTAVSAWVVLWYLFTHENSVVITSAPTWRQVSELLWREIRSAHVLAPYPLGGVVLQTKLELGDQWFALGVSTDKPEKMQGYHSASGNILLVIDEASGVDQSIFDSAEGFLTSEGARLLLIGNPTQVSGEFYNAFRSPLYHKIHISAWDSPNLQAGKVVRPYLITPDWVDEKRIKWGEDSPLWYARVLGEFPEQGDDTLIPLAWIERAQARYFDTPAGQPTALGVDVARFGSDTTVIISRRGIKAELVRQLRKHDTMEVAGAVIHAIKETGIRTPHVDVIGLGAGVVDRLRELRYPVVEVNVGEASHETDRFVNLRAEYYWDLRERFRDGQIAIFADEELECQLASLKYGFASRGQIKIESKDDMRKRGLSSPDMADALMLAFISPRTTAAMAVGDERESITSFQVR